MTFKLTSPAFREGETIPTKYTGDGSDLSPPLTWSDPPARTVSLALICEDPDAPRGTWTHWVLYNLGTEARSLSEAVETVGQTTEGYLQGKNDFGQLGYGGPAPPRGKPHRYFFRLFALDTLLSLPSGATRAELLSAMKGHVLAETTLIGNYKR